MIYLDTCAVAKLARHERETEALFDWLDAREHESLVSSVLLEIELERALRRVEPAALPRIPRILSGISRVELNAAIRAAAGAYQDPLLRSLDAIHLATAQTIAESTGTEISAFVTYDKRLIAAARAVGVHVEHPGARY
ncbi:type II toxin-antitoxin system VapC family toxin [Actinospica sp. MGRD01-02]|uniref:Ribonuclease VapC n=1 Tax=Actinospica acidithermotolerans TaxID=2828514 RepID=A0A941INH4_9ACTN|nr:type II toxin-antitoxin system VapC family toxin [Actinospica acidithermotolerans]MBR7831028.1 type II toxin-antitoxin system VapC family toxin [Actinospica acidithermotolerans]